MSRGYSGRVGTTHPPFLGKGKNYGCFSIKAFVYVCATEHMWTSEGNLRCLSVLVVHILWDRILLPALCTGSAEAGIFLLHLPSLCRMVLQMCVGIRDKFRLSLGLAIWAQFPTLECQALYLPGYQSCMTLSFVEGTLHWDRRPLSSSWRNRSLLSKFVSSGFWKDACKSCIWQPKFRPDNGPLTIPEMGSGALGQEMM